MTEKEFEELILEAKKDLTVEEIKNALRKCSYGGEPVAMDLRGGEKINGKTHT